MTRAVKNPGRGYSGLEKIKVYVYNSKGSFEKSYNSLSEFKKDNNLDKTYPIFRNNYKRSCIENERNKSGYAKLPNGVFVCKTRLGRDFLIKNEKIINSFYFCFGLYKSSKNRVSISHQRSK